jgi:flavin-dependent dehydrogenase
VSAHAVAVLGGGPAGVMLARRLATSGVDVALYAAPGAGGVEGWSARTRALVCAEGCAEVEALLGEPVRRSGSWGSGRVVDGVEWLAPRAGIDAALRRSARAAGVTVIEEVVTGVSATARDCRIETRARTARALHVVDARGRRGAHAARGPALLSVSQAYRLRRTRAAATLIAPWSNGWCWSASRGRELWVQVVGRPSDVRVHGPRRWLAAAAAEIAPLPELLATAEPVGGLVARAAHARLGATCTAARRWLTGDAAVALDPLSGQGAYEAMRGAIALSAAMLTTLDGGDAVAAREYVTARSETLWATAAQTASDIYRENAAAGRLWRELADAYARAVPVRAAVAAHVALRPVLLRDRIVRAHVVVTAQQPRGVYEIDGVPAAALLECLRAVPALELDAIAQRVSSSTPRVRNALRWLARAGLSSAAFAAVRS